MGGQHKRESIERRKRKAAKAAALRSFRLVQPVVNDAVLALLKFAEEMREIGLKMIERCSLPAIAIGKRYAIPQSDIIDDSGLTPEMVDAVAVSPGPEFELPIDPRYGGCDFTFVPLHEPDKYEEVVNGFLRSGMHAGLRVNGWEVLDIRGEQTQSPIKAMYRIVWRRIDPPFTNAPPPPTSAAQGEATRSC